MNETLSFCVELFTLTFLGLAALSFASGSFSTTGRHLPLSLHPAIVRIRWFAFGLFAALSSQGYDWRHPGIVGFTTATLLLVSAVRFRSSPRAGSPPDINQLKNARNA